MNNEDLRIAIHPHTKHILDELLKEFEDTDAGQLIDFSICFVSAVIDEFPSVLIDHVTNIMMKKVRDYYDSPVGVSNQ